MKTTDYKLHASKMLVFWIYLHQEHSKTNIWRPRMYKQFLLVEMSVLHDNHKQYMWSCGKIYIKCSWMTSSFFWLNEKKKICNDSDEQKRNLFPVRKIWICFSEIFKPQCFRLNFKSCIIQSEARFFFEYHR